MCVVYCIFCFKQKAAYEVRISDWSSDVCSSELFYLEKRWRATQTPKNTEKNTLGRIIKARRVAQGLFLFAVRVVTGFTALAHFAECNPEGIEIASKIGRASCRASVWKYV